MPPHFHTVVFDLDGVLIDTIEVARKAFAHAYKTVVGDDEPPFNEYRRYLGLAFPDIMRVMRLPEAMLCPFVEESNRLTPTIRIFDGVTTSLNRLKSAGVNVGVATGKDGLRARKVLHEVGLLCFIDLVVGSDEVARPKPAPDMVLRHLDYFATAPARTLMVGDSPADIAAGQAAGVVTAAALWGDGDRALLRAARPEFVLSHISELQGVLGV